MAIYLLKGAALFYIVATVATSLHVLKPSESGDRRTLVAIFVAMMVHALAVGGRVVEVAALPMAGVSDALSVFSLILGVISIVVSVRGGVPQVMWLATPLIALLVGIAALGNPPASVPESLKSIYLATHICVALFGDAAFAVAGLVAVVYLLQERRLKRLKKRKKGKKGKRSKSNPKQEWGVATAMNNLPALEALDNVSVALFKFGFPMMTLGILTGVLYGKQVLDVYWTWDARNTVTAIVWVLYAAMLYARLVIGWRGRKAAFLTVVGVVAIVLTFVGLGLARGGMHGGGGLS